MNPSTYPGTLSCPEFPTFWSCSVKLPPMKSSRYTKKCQFFFYNWNFSPGIVLFAEIYEKPSGRSVQWSWIVSKWEWTQTADVSPNKYCPLGLCNGNSGLCNQCQKSVRVMDERSRSWKIQLVSSSGLLRSLNFCVTGIQICILLLFYRIPASMKRVIYCHAIKYGGVEEWNFLWERYKRSNVASEKTSILKALACSRDAKILNRYVNGFFVIHKWHRMYSDWGTTIISGLQFYRKNHQSWLGY